MKRLLLYTLFATLFAACTQNEIDEQSVNRQEVPKTLTVGFEGDDTRIQLQNGKTVWTKGDHVSVFYRSTINEEWQFMGETGDRTGQIVPVDNSVNPPATHNHVVVAYPYSADYFYNTETHNVEASLPAVQNYLKDSYGTNGNIMISSSEFNKVSLKSVCGWLKLQLTGDGEVVKSITLRGNNGEQVAGELYINSADATAVLASEMGSSDDNNAGGSLVFDNTILTEVTLDCGEGVALGKNTTAFYIALPPQTFEKGFTVDIECDGYEAMTLSTSNALTIVRNTIQPMASVEHNTTPIIPNNQIWYTSSDGNIVKPYKTNAFGANILSNTYNAEKECWVIEFDGDVTTIGNFAFDNCTSLTSVTIPDSVTTIGYEAFSYCTRLTSVTIGDSVTSIGDYAFYSCDSLTSVTIGDSVTSIGDDAFYGCDSLTSVTIGDSVTVIGDGAFYNCTSLTSVTIGDSVFWIGSYAFCRCESLTSVTIPDSVTSIGNSAFQSCESLTSVTIPDSVTTIGSYAFYNCTSLAEFNGKFAEDNGRILVVDGTLIAFAPAGLTSYSIPDSVTTIGGGAFGWCESLTSVTIPDSVTTIGYGAFNNCTSLTSVTIPDSVNTIGELAFYWCTSLTSVYCKATTPPSLGSSVFDINGSGRKIYVPTNSVSTYKSAKYWRDYASAIVGYNF